jgi:hypothetical protein
MNMFTTVAWRKPSNNNPAEEARQKKEKSKVMTSMVLVIYTGLKHSSHFMNSASSKQVQNSQTGLISKLLESR